MKALTVAELIKQLQGQPAGALVYLEGCDCINPAKEAVYGGHPFDPNRPDAVTIKADLP